MTTAVLAEGASTVASAPPPSAPRRRRFDPAALGLVPFAAYVLVFLLLPTAIAIGTGFLDSDGALTLDNIAGLLEPTILRTFGNSIWLSALTAIVGAVLGALACYAMLGLPEGGRTRTTVDAAASVLAQFGGVMLAFAFIATLGAQGLITRLILDLAGVDIHAGGNWLYALPGLVPTYLFFQVPLMVITFMPAMDALQLAWAEANLTLGGTRFGFWRWIGIPVLSPAFLASLLLLFANAFSSYATAAALASQGAQIVPLQIRAALTSETVLGRENLAGALALGMIAVVSACMWGYSAIQRRAARWRR